MITEESVLECWLNRHAPMSDTTTVTGLSHRTKREVISLFLTVLDADVDHQDSSPIELKSATLSRCAHEERIGADVYLNELLCAQIALLEIIGTSGAQDSICVTHCSHSLNRLVAECMVGYHECHDQGVRSHQSNVGSRTLQHEIRTPLQGALLTCELVIEEIDNNNRSLLSDMHTIKQSLESAIVVLNDFSSTD